MTDGIERVYAARLVEFIPAIYCRLLLRPSGVRFSETFVRELESGEWTGEQTLGSHPVWLEISHYASTRGQDLSPAELLSIAARSAEFDAVNQMLNDGSKPRDLILSPLVLKWPEDGPTLKSSTS